MVQEQELSSTYQSFDIAESYLDLSRTRSDESLFWSAGEEAAVIVAELKASLVPSDSKDMPQGPIKTQKSHSYTNLSPNGNPFENGPSVKFQKPNLIKVNWDKSGAKLSNGTPLTYRRRDVASKTPPGAFPPHSPRNKGDICKSGSWRSLLKMGSLNRGRAGSGAKKVPPPTVPESGTASSASSTCSSSSSHRHSGSSFSSGVFSVDQRSSFSSSIGEETSHLPPSPNSPGRDSGCEPTMAGSISSTTSSGSSSSGSSGPVRSGTPATGGPTASPSHGQNNQFTFPSQGPQFAHLLCPKVPPGSPHHGPPPEVTTYPYQPYAQQMNLEDQGIDVQSPGRSSPGSGSGSSTSGSTASSANCRNSTSSLDSGRASSSTQTHTHRLSGQSYESNVSLRHSYHSSNSSIGSLEQDPPPLKINVLDLLSKGVADSEVLRLWLTELRFEEYYQKFLTAGYDMPTISRMTPEDLNAIGITKPAHRKRLKTEISRLNISDGLPEYIPSRLEEWLTLLRLENYIHPLKQQNYTTVQQVTQITWEDLEDVGIKKLGHQKKVMLAIKRVKDIMAGKKVGQASQEDKIYTTGLYCRPDPFNIRPESRVFHDQNGFYMQHNRLEGHLDPGGGQSIYRVPLNQKPHPGGYYDFVRSTVPNHAVCYRPDVIAVNYGRANQAHFAQEPIYGTCQSFFPESANYYPPKPVLHLQNGVCPQQRSFDDGDITPTNENANIYEGGGTLPRPRTANKYRPVAKVTAKTRVDVHEIPPQFLKQETSKDTNDGSCNNSANTTPTPTPQGTPKKMPPPPPRRSNSLSENSTINPKESSTGGTLQRKAFSYNFMGGKNTLQPDVTPDMPPPPPAPQDKGNHQHLPHQDFPPPPPPLTCITSVRTAHSTSVSQGENGSTCSTLFNQDDSGTGFRPRRNESNSSFKSTSSSDSGESLPFANDNAGTIKQRGVGPRPNPSFNLLSSATSSPRSSPASSPALLRKEGIVHPTLRQSPQGAQFGRSSAPNPSTPIKSLRPEDATDVLSDIGNMLANLTDELDAMLEQEMNLTKQTAS